MTRPYISLELRRQLEQDSRYRCGYCLSEAALTGISLSIDHIIPIMAGGTTDRENLWSACRPCNENKNNRTQAEDVISGEFARLFNPRTQNWYEHFTWNEDKTEIIGLTPTGRATVSALQLNRPLLVRARLRWVLAGFHPPVD